MYIINIQWVTASVSSQIKQMITLSEMCLAGVIIPVEDLEGTLQVSFDSSTTKILLPMASAYDMPSVPSELFAKFQISFYTDPVDAVFKALGVS